MKVLAIITALVLANPIYRRQAVTAIIPKPGSLPSCGTSRSGSFGITVVMLDGSQTNSTGSLKQVAGGQSQSNAVTQITDGQPQSQNAVKQIPDGQPQAQNPVKQIPDGQPQAQNPVKQIPDGQPQAQNPVKQIPDGQPQAQNPVKQITDGQPQAESNSNKQPSGIGKACSGSDVLTLTLKDGILKDAFNRTGYIASNYQFQFDEPPQAGAVYTAGFSLCSNGTLGLGDSTVFYKCRSGDFYNLYDRHIGSDCYPINFDLIELTSC